MLGRIAIILAVDLNWRKSMINLNALLLQERLKRPFYQFIIMLKDWMQKIRLRYI